MRRAPLPAGWTKPSTFTGAAIAAPLEQYNLFHEVAVLELPAPAGADIFSVVQVESGKLFYLKADKFNRPVCASEWLAYGLARLVGILVPPCAVVRLEDGRLVFGSQKVSGVADEIDTSAYLSTFTRDELGRSNIGLTRILSELLAFDLAIGNIDRHARNLLSTIEGDMRRLHAIDFGRSLFWDWPWQGLPAQDSRTSETSRELRLRHGFDYEAADVILDRLSGIDASTVGTILNQMPKNWLSPELRNDILAFWSDGRWQSRIDETRKALRHAAIV